MFFGPYPFIMALKETAVNVEDFIDTDNQKQKKEKEKQKELEKQELNKTLKFKQRSKTIVGFKQDRFSNHYFLSIYNFIIFSYFFFASELLEALI
ncbi:MAG: hypothetical protein EZS28_003079 [Streblomastix strix]|uniref:Uncharacterized protein n=1 Tax=Streblomastix strix TaxID=222440 RepID=A0A5J4X3Q7_9EUKA|nr:MAG: hypothetical protein EZS28_003079 [Streblomastix strix]